MSSLSENQVIAKMSSFQYLTLIVALKTGYLSVLLFIYMYIYSGSSNPEVSVLNRSTPLNSSRRCTMHRKRSKHCGDGVDSHTV